ncbi:MAG: hypothetical protein ACYDCQ_22880 [Dehalococcoidia bacterium]
MSGNTRKPRLLKVEGIAFALELRELFQTIEAVSRWLDELPEPIERHLYRLIRIGHTAATRSERRHALWSADCWFFMEQDDGPHRAARDWLYANGDYWMEHDPRRQPTARQALRAAEHLLIRAQPKPPTDAG